MVISNYTLFCKFTKNNIFIHILNNKKNIIYTISAGKLKFKNKRKQTLFAIKTLLDNAIEYLKLNNILEFILQFKGISIFKQTIYSNLFNLKLFHIIQVIDTSSISYNGCKAKKKRRL